MANDYIFSELNKKFGGRVRFKIASLAFSSVASGGNQSQDASSQLNSSSDNIIYRISHNVSLTSINTTLDFRGSLPFGIIPAGELNVDSFKLPIISAFAGNGLSVTLNNGETSTISMNLYMRIIEFPQGMLQEEGAIDYVNELVRQVQ